MQRRGGHRQHVKRRRTVKVKTRKAPAANSSIDPRKKLLERLARERDEALDQQAATAEVLNVISSSPGQLETVFQTILANATRLCGAKFGTLYFREGDRLRLIATHGVPQAFAEAQGKAPFHPVPDGMLDAVMRTGRTGIAPPLTAYLAARIPRVRGAGTSA